MVVFRALGCGNQTLAFVKTDRLDHRTGLLCPITDAHPIKESHCEHPTLPNACHCSWQACRCLRCLQRRCAPAASVEQALAAIRKAGFNPQPLQNKSGDAVSDLKSGSNDHDHGAGSGGAWRMGGALLLAIGAEVLGFFAPDTLVWKGAGLALAAAAIWLAGFDVYKKGLTALRHGRLNINALMTVAVSGAFVIGQSPEAAMVMAL